LPEPLTLLDPDPPPDVELELLPPGVAPLIMAVGKELGPPLLLPLPPLVPVPPLRLDGTARISSTSRHSGLLRDRFCGGRRDPPCQSSDQREMNIITTPCDSLGEQMMRTNK
jgi:hypothetical protein